jgi:two-component system, NtrC family, sensor kinase
MTWNFGFSQNSWRDGIIQRLNTATTDTSRVLAMAEMCRFYKYEKPDSALYYGYNALLLAQKINFPKGEALILRELPLAEIAIGNEPKGLQLYLKLEKIAEENNFSLDKAISIWGKGWYYLKAREYETALGFFKESFMLFDSGNNNPFSSLALASIAETFLERNKLDSALFYALKAYNQSIQVENNWSTYYTLIRLARVYGKSGNTNLANSYFRQSLSGIWLTESFFTSYFEIAKLFQQTGMQDSAIFYAKKSLSIAQENGYYRYIIDANIMLSDIYEITDIQQALFYSKDAIAWNDSLNHIVKRTTQQTITEFDEQERLREMEVAKAEFQNRLRMNSFLGSTFTLIVIAIFLFILSRRKQKAKQKIEAAFVQLKSTQSQLIQAEKMASLGELTAGIAHEIQNPLNFVNNFSDVNSELIDELSEEVDKGNLDEVKTIAKDIKENEQKINHHGKRADAIVKGMLQHSRTSNGVKEPTDINALADEYLRLSYHGLRAKDKSFNAEFKTEFDESLPKINVIPQDIGRVLLNLINNAFYVVSEKAKNNIDDYKPEVIVRTSSNNPPSGGRGASISVIDNGPGIPAHIVDKIFQPFFTTKPTGQGTGLGLSLAYDIVKAHGGEIIVESVEGEGTKFIIHLPTS